MFRLYWAPDTGAFIGHAALEEIGADYTLQVIDYSKQENKEAEYLAVNPKGQLPALQLADGGVVTESVAILLHLDDLYPDGGLLPERGTMARANAYRWLLYMTTNTYGNDLRYYYSERYTVDPEGVEGVKQAAAHQMDGDFDYMDEVLGHNLWLAGEPASIADTYLTMMVMWHWDVPSLLDRCSNIARVVRAVRKRAAIERIWEQNFPDAPML